MIEATLSLFEKGILLVVMLSAPALLVAVIVGVSVAFIQTLVQVQDQTLSHAVKLVAVSISLIATGGWIGGELINLTNAIFVQVIYVH